MRQLVQPQSLPLKLVVAVEHREPAVHCGNKVVVHALGHVVGAQGRLQCAAIVPRLCAEYIQLHIACIQRCDCVFMFVKALIELLVRLLAHGAVLALQEACECGLCQGLLCTVLVYCAELHIHVGEGRECLVGCHVRFGVEC